MLMQRLSCRLSLNTIPLVQRETQAFEQCYYGLAQLIQEGDMLAFENSILMKAEASRRLAGLASFLQQHQQHQVAQYLRTSTNTLNRIIQLKPPYLKINESHIQPPWKNTYNQHNIHNTTTHQTREEPTKAQLHPSNQKQSSISSKKHVGNNSWCLLMRKGSGLCSKEQRERGCVGQSRQKVNGMNRLLSGSKRIHSKQNSFTSNDSQAKPVEWKQNSCHKKIGRTKEGKVPNGQQQYKGLLQDGQISFNNLACSQAKSKDGITYTLKLTKQDYASIMRLKKALKPT